MIVKFPDGQRINMDQVGGHALVTGGIEFLSGSGTILGTYNPGSPYLIEAFLDAIDQAALRKDGFLDLSILFASTIIGLATSPFAASDTVTVTGTGFKTGAKAFIGGQEVPGGTAFGSATSITFVAPDKTLEPFLSVYNAYIAAGAPGADIRVLNPDGTIAVVPQLFSWT